MPDTPARSNTSGMSDLSAAAVKPVTPLSRLPNFDARKMAVLGVDSHLPAIAPERLQPDALRQRFTTPPLWQPEIYAEHRFTDRAPMHAAVLVAIVMREQPMVLLTERTAHLSTHSGQIAFAGGKADATDADAAATALREAQEEVGLDPRFVQVLGNLPTYTTGTAFIITPVVALVQPDFTVTPNTHEVADVFEVPLQFLMDPANHQRHALEWEGLRREWFSIPYSDTSFDQSRDLFPGTNVPQDAQHSDARQRFIWGATAGMLRNFYGFLSA
jgi:8-oxo-dGTP pyrophosphatase MutT (NUDIX family)